MTKLVTDIVVWLTFNLFLSFRY